MINNVINWANDRNLIKGSTHQAQFIKTVSEIGELVDAMFTDPSNEEALDAIGDIQVCLIIMCEQVHLDYTGILDVVCDPGQDIKVQPSTLVIGLLSQTGRMADLISKGSTNLTNPISCILRILKLAAALHNKTLDDCLEKAYDVIKDRKGTMIDGFFVKED